MQSGERDLFELRARLRRVVGRDRVRCDPGELALYDTDALALHRATPGGVVQVASEEEVVGVLRIFAEAGVPFVARGAGTGLSGGAVPLAGAWVVDLNRMRRIIALHAEDRFAVVEPGVVNIDLDRAARAHGLRYAPDPSSQRASTIGGNVAENAGGPHCFLHGTTTTHVLGLTLILPNGERVTLGGPPGCAPDIDLRGLVVGAEGTLGVVTEIVV